MSLAKGWRPGSNAPLVRLSTPVPRLEAKTAGDSTTGTAVLAILRRSAAHAHEMFGDYVVGARCLTAETKILGSTPATAVQANEFEADVAQSTDLLPTYWKVVSELSTVSYRRNLDGQV